MNPVLPPAPSSQIMNPELDVFIQSSSGGVRTASHVEAIRAHTLAIANCGATIARLTLVVQTLAQNMDALKDQLDALKAEVDALGQGDTL